MVRIDVWLQRAGSGFHISVDGLTNARWLHSRLSHEFVFKNSSTIQQENDSSIYGFHIACVPPMSFAKLESLLNGIPSLNVTTEVSANNNAEGS